LWLWPDLIEFGLWHTTRSSVRLSLGDGAPLELAPQTPEQKADAIFRLTETLKEVSNDGRVTFLAEFGSLYGVDIPPNPPLTVSLTGTLRSEFLKTCWFGRLLK